MVERAVIGDMKLREGLLVKLYDAMRRNLRAHPPRGVKPPPMDPQAVGQEPKEAAKRLEVPRQKDPP
jgi:hypothetical protein